MAIKTKAQVVSLDIAAAMVIEAGLDESITLSKVSAFNSDVVARVVSIYHDVTGSAGAVAGTLIMTKSISAGDTITLPLSSVYVANSAKLYAAASVDDKINLDLNYTTSDQQH